MQNTVAKKESVKGRLTRSDNFFIKSSSSLAFGHSWSEVLQLCSHPVIGWQDAPPGIYGLWFIQVAAI
jgi:hypothetical protein